MFAAVADCMGGPAGGERANMIAAEREYDYWRSLRADISGFDPIAELKSCTGSAPTGLCKHSVSAVGFASAPSCQCLSVTAYRSLDMSLITGRQARLKL